MKNNVQMVLLCGVFCFFLTESTYGIKKNLVAAGFAYKKLNNKDDEYSTQITSAASQPVAARSPVAQGGIAIESTNSIAANKNNSVVATYTKTKTEKIIDNVTSISYPFRLNVFAGDYCYPQFYIICAPPL